MIWQMNVRYVDLMSGYICHHMLTRGTCVTHKLFSMCLVMSRPLVVGTAGSESG